MHLAPHQPSKPLSDQKHRWKRWLLLACCALVTVVALSYVVMFRPNPFYRASIVPRLVTANFVDFDKVYVVSKFRSGYGHEYSSDGETCRSMKHYVNFSHNMGPGYTPIRSQPTSAEPNITIYAPFDGYIWATSTENIGTQVTLYSKHNPWYDARFFHIDLKPGLRFGSSVQAGQAIGTVGPRDGFDISFESSSWGPGGHKLSIFSAMTDEAFKPWADAGFSRGDFIVTKQTRDAQPFQCDASGHFTDMADHTARDFVTVHPDPYAST